MQLTEALCYAILTITVTATCARAESRRHELADRKSEKRLNRREAAVIIDNFPVDAIFKSNIQKPNVIYRRLSRQRYASLNPTYGPPRPKHGPPISSRRPGKQHRGKSTKPKYGPPNHKKRPKSKRRPPHRPSSRPMYGPPIETPHYLHYQPQSLGYGEPPVEYIPDYQPPKKSYANSAEPPVDSYGAPLKVVHGMFPTVQSYSDTTGPFENPKYNLETYNQQQNWKNSKNNFGNDYQEERQNPKINFGNDYQVDLKNTKNIFVNQEGNWKNQNDNFGNQEEWKKPKNNFGNQQQNWDDHNTKFGNQDEWKKPNSNVGNQQDWKSLQHEPTDNNYAYSKKQPVFARPAPTIFVTPIPNNEDDDNMNYSDNYRHRQRDDDDVFFNDKIKKPQYFTDHTKVVNRPWKAHKGRPEYDAEIIVGGQYAEPPARHLPSYQPSGSDEDDDDDDDGFNPVKRYADSGEAATATNSPYVNYKNSNMAFSPQNLNDAFSIVD